MAPLCPARVAPSVLTATAHVCWSLTSSFLATVVAGGVVWIPPGRAGGGQELVKSRCGCRLRVSNVISLVTIRASHRRGSSRWWLLLSWLSPSCRRLGTARGVHGVRLAGIRSPVREWVVIIKLVVRKAMVV